MLKQLDTVIGLAVVMSVVSLLITIATQAVSSVLALRGQNLADALEALATRIAPELAGKIPGLTHSKARDLVDWVLTDDMVSDSISSMRKSRLFNWFAFTRLGIRWQRATAIRPDELLDILQKFAFSSKDSAGAPPKEVQEAAKVLLDQLFRAPDPARTPALDPAKASVEDATKTAAPDAAKTSVEDPARPSVEDLVKTMALQDRARLEAWFNSAQDRAKQWFTMHARVVTVVCSFIAAFWLQLDLFTLVHRLSSDSDLRASLVAAAPAFTKQAEAGLDAASLFSQTTHGSTLATLSIKWPAITNVVLPTNVASTTERDDQVRQQIARLFPSNEVDTVFASYTNTANEVAVGNVRDWNRRFETVSDQLSGTGLDLVPQPYPCRFSTWIGPWSHFFGMLAAAALLSLGAPFWFNQLKTLTNLRSALAQQIDKDNDAPAATTK